MGRGFIERGCRVLSSVLVKVSIVRAVGDGVDLTVSQVSDLFVLDRSRGTEGEGFIGSFIVYFGDSGVNIGSKVKVLVSGQP